MRLVRTGLFDDLVDASRTIALFGRIVEPIIDRDRLPRVPKPQMRRLIFLVVRVRDEDRREPVEGDFAVGPRVFDTSRLAGSGQLQVVWMVMKGPGCVAAEDIGVERRIGEAGPQAPAKARSDVAHAAQLIPNPALFEVGPDLGALVSRQSAEDGLGRDHPRLHRGVIALDLRYVEKPGGIPDQRAAREIEPRDRLEAALVECPRPISDPPAAFEKRADRRVRLEALELLERV